MTNSKVPTDGNIWRGTDLSLRSVIHGGDTDGFFCFLLHFTHSFFVIKNKLHIYGDRYAELLHPLYMFDIKETRPESLSKLSMFIGILPSNKIHNYVDITRLFGPKYTT